MKPEANDFKEFQRGDLVRVRMTPDIVGQVVGEKDWGKSYLVRLGGTMEQYWLEDVEIEPYKPKSKANAGYEEEPEKGLPSADIIDLAAVRAAGRA